MPDIASTSRFNGAVGGAIVMVGQCARPPRIRRNAVPSSQRVELDLERCTKDD